MISIAGLLDTDKNLTWERRDPHAVVLFVTNMWPDEERPVYGIFVKRQINSLVAIGMKCDVLYVRGYRGSRAYLAASLYFLTHRAEMLKRYRLVHAHAGETALAVTGLSGIPRVASYCGDDVLGHPRQDGSYSPMHRLRRAIIKQQSRLMDATITKSAEMGRVLPSSSRKTNNVVPNGVNLKQFCLISRQQARAELGWSQDEKIVLFAATRPREVRKRLDLAEAAVRLAEQKVGQIHLMIAENQPPDRVPLLMNAADCLLLTSISEGSPNVVKEALMCNLPVVSTDVGDVAELLDGVEPSAVCVDDPVSLGTAVARVFDVNQRSNGRDARSELNELVIAQRLLGVYEAAGYDAAEDLDPS